MPITIRALLLLLLFAATRAGAQSVDTLHQQLAGATGAGRARILSKLTDALKNDRPAEAIADGEEGLTLLAAHPDPVLEVRTLAELGWAYMVAGKSDRATALEEQARAIAEKHGDRQGLARAINNLGVVAQRAGDGLKAVDLFDRSLAVYRELNDRANVAGELNNLGFVYTTELADYERALTYHMQALKVRQAIGDRAAIALSLNNIGIVYSHLGEHAQALDSYRQALAIRNSLPGQQNRIAAIVNNIGDEYFAVGRLNEALDAHRQALDIRQTVGDRSGQAISWKNIGIVLGAKQDYAPASQALDRGLALAQQIGDRSTAALCLIGLAGVHRQQGHTGQAVAEARRAVELAQQMASPETLEHAWQELSASQERAGDAAGALASYKNYKQTGDRIFDEEKARRVEVLERRYQDEKRETEIQRLRSQEAVNQIEVARRRLQLEALGGGALALGLVGFGLYRRRVESARLAAELSVTDAMTGVKNRRFVQQTIGAEIAGCDRRTRNAGGRPVPGNDVVFMLLDVDDFKSVNDGYGHAAGDAVLIQLAARLTDVCRATDSIVRWGGEEFLVIHRAADRRMAPAIAERIRSTIAGLAFQIGDGRTLGRTCSIGFASYPFSATHPQALGWEQVVGLADQALYFAKRAGANGWVGLSAADAATVEQLQHRSVDDLVRAVAGGAIVAESSAASALLAPGQTVQQ